MKTARDYHETTKRTTGVARTMGDERDRRAGTSTCILYDFPWSESLWTASNPYEAEVAGTRLGDVVDRFHELCQQAGIHAYWQPATSQLMGDCGTDYDAGKLHELRKQAIAECKRRK